MLVARAVLTQPYAWQPAKRVTAPNFSCAKHSHPRTVTHHSVVACTHAHVDSAGQAAIITGLAHVAAGHQAGAHWRPACLWPHVLVKDGDGDGQSGHRVGDVHDATDAALAGAAGQQQVDLQGGGGR